MLAVLCCFPAEAEDWTIQGREYHNVVVQNVTADHVDISFDGGVGSPRLADLPPDLQKRFNYQPPDSAAAMEARAAASAEIERAAGHILPVKVGETEIKLSEPPGMTELSKDNPMYHSITDMTPDDLVLLRTCVSSEALEAEKAPDTSGDIFFSRTFSVKEATMDIDYGNFINLVQRLAFVTSHGVLVSQDSPVDFIETEKRLDQFQKDTGIAVKEDSDVYSLGMISRSDGCVAYMTAQYLKATAGGKTEREKCVNVVAYLLLKKKLVIAVISLTKNMILRGDLQPLIQEAEKYQLSLQNLNNQ